MKNKHKTTSTQVMMATVVAVIGLVAGCGSSTQASPHSESTSASASSVQAQVDAIIAQAEARPTSILYSTPVGKPIPTGKTFVYLALGPGPNIAVGDLIKKAVTLLGWNYKPILTDGSSQQIQNAFVQAIRMKPDAVAYAGPPLEEVQTYVKQLADEGTNVVTWGQTSPIGGTGLLWNTFGPATLAQVGKVEAAYIAHATAGNPTSERGVLRLNIPDYPPVTASGVSLKANYATFCPGCAFAQLDVSLANLGTANDQAISFVRAHPGTKYVVLGVDGAFPGVAAAIASAGLGVKVLGYSPTAASLAAIQNGQQEATIAYDTNNPALGMVDAAVRKLAGVPVIPGDDAPNPLWIVTKDNVKQATLTPDGYFVDVISGAAAQWAALWGK